MAKCHIGLKFTSGVKFSLLYLLHSLFQLVDFHFKLGSVWTELGDYLREFCNLIC